MISPKPASLARSIEAQVGVLERMLAETDEKIAQHGQTIDAIAASRREAEQTRKEFWELQSNITWMVKRQGTSQPAL